MQTIFAIHKPKGPTSFDMVAKVRRATGIRKVGHAGTLDPLASGVLVVGVTREGTKKMHGLVKNDKEYIATIKLGQTSTTDDEEGEKTDSLKTNNQPTQEDLENALKHFEGEIKQVPPIYSAIKIKGKPAYKYAREGKDIKLEPRDALIKEIEVQEYEWPMATIRFVTGSGVYIRSLARDIGEALNTGGYLADLQRTRVGEFSLDQALTIEEFSKVWENNNKNITS